MTAKRRFSEHRKQISKIFYNCCIGISFGSEKKIYLNLNKHRMLLLSRSNDCLYENILSKIDVGFYRSLSIRYIFFKYFHN